MKKCLLAVLAAASVAASGCSSYSPGGFAASMGLPSARDALADGSLKERYPDSRDPSFYRYPDGASAPPARPAAQGSSGSASFAPWILRPLDREAERKSIARDSPYASVSPSGTASGY